MIYIKRINFFYCVFIKKIEPDKNEYPRAVFFYQTPDNELKMLEVDFPPANEYGAYLYDAFFDLFISNSDKFKIIEKYGYQMYTICDNKDIWVCENGNYVITDTDKDGYLEVLRQIEGDEDDLTTVFEFSEEGLLSEYETQEEFHMVKGLFDEPSNENVYYSLYTLVFNG